MPSRSGTQGASEPEAGPHAPPDGPQPDRVAGRPPQVDISLLHDRSQDAGAAIERNLAGRLASVDQGLKLVRRQALSATLLQEIVQMGDAFAVRGRAALRRGEGDQGLLRRDLENHRPGALRC